MKVEKTAPEILAANTQIQEGSPYDQDKVLALYQGLYNNPLLQPLLDIAAIAMDKPEGYPLKSRKNLEIIFQPGEGESKKAGMVRAYYLENQDKIKVASAREEIELKGTLIHEICHMVANHVYQNKSKPYPKKEADKKTAYKDAVKTDLPKHYYIASDKNVDISKAFTEPHDKKLYKSNEWKEEQIVRIPQLIATDKFYVEDINVIAPGTLEYYRDVFLPDCIDFIKTHNKELGEKYLENTISYESKGYKEASGGINRDYIIESKEARIEMARGIITSAKAQVYGLKLGHMSSSMEKILTERIAQELREELMLMPGEDTPYENLQKVQENVAKVIACGFKERGAFANVVRSHKPKHREFDQFKVNLSYALRAAIYEGLNGNDISEEDMYPKNKEDISQNLSRGNNARASESLGTRLMHAIRDGQFREAKDLLEGSGAADIKSVHLRLAFQDACNEAKSLALMKAFLGKPELCAKLTRDDFKLVLRKGEDKIKKYINELIDKDKDAGAKYDRATVLNVVKDMTGVKRSPRFEQGLEHTLRDILGEGRFTHHRSQTVTGEQFNELLERANEGKDYNPLEAFLVSRSKYTKAERSVGISP